MCKSSSGLQTDHGSRGNFPPSCTIVFSPISLSSKRKTGQLRVICSPHGDIHSLFSGSPLTEKRVFPPLQCKGFSGVQSQINQHGIHYQFPICRQMCRWYFWLPFVGLSKQLLCQRTHNWRFYNCRIQRIWIQRIWIQRIWNVRIWFPGIWNLRIQNQKLLWRHLPNIVKEEATLTKVRKCGERELSFWLPAVLEARQPATMDEVPKNSGKGSRLAVGGRSIEKKGILERREQRRGRWDLGRHCCRFHVTATPSFASLASLFFHLFVRTWTSIQCDYQSMLFTPLFMHLSVQILFFRPFL